MMLFFLEFRIWHNGFFNYIFVFSFCVLPMLLHTCPSNKKIRKNTDTLRHALWDSLSCFGRGLGFCRFLFMHRKLEKKYFQSSRNVNIATTKALEQETERARREEHGRNKFRGALWGSNNELKLRREERDQSRVDSLILKDELKACLRSKRNLSQRLCETETNMLAIISKYQEELNLAMAHEHKVAHEYA